MIKVGQQAEDGGTGTGREEEEATGCERLADSRVAPRRDERSPGRDRERETQGRATTTIAQADQRHALLALVATANNAYIL